MLIVCPSCEAAYDVPEAAAAPGRVVRCARCLREWKLDGQPPPAAAPSRAAAAHSPAAEERPSRIGLMAHAPASAFALDAPPPVPGVVEDPGPPPPGFYDDPPAPRARSGVAAVAWIASIAILAGLLWAGYRYREDVMHAWPATERLYAALGLRAAPLP